MLLTKPAARLYTARSALVDEGKADAHAGAKKSLGAQGRAVHAPAVQLSNVARAFTCAQCTPRDRAPRPFSRYSILLLYWYKSTNTDAKTRRLRGLCLGTHFSCFTGTKVQ